MTGDLPPSTGFDAARQETVRYHEELYASIALGAAGTWLAKPHPLLAEALETTPRDRSVVAFDLGSGIGRHTIPMLAAFAPGSQVYAVDLLPSALATLVKSVPSGMPSTLRICAADLEEFDFEQRADLVFTFSALEHLPGPAAIRALLDRVDSALEPGAVVAIGMVVDRVEITDDGRRRSALLESALTAAEASDLLAGAFADHDLIRHRESRSDVREQRGEESYILSSTLVTWMSTKPRHART